MQENNFEKQVQHDLEGLRMNPSENVWLKVESSLKKKKDRRVLVLLLSMASLLIAGLLTYNFYNPADSKKQPELTVASTPIKDIPQAAASTVPARDGSNQTGGASLDPVLPQATNQQKAPSSLLVQVPGKSLVIENDEVAAPTAGNKTLLYKVTKVRSYAGAKTAVEVNGAVIETLDEDDAAGLLPKQHATFNLSGLTGNRLSSELHIIGTTINGKALTLPIVAAEKQAISNKNSAKPGKKISIAIEAGVGRAGTANSYLGNIPNNTFYDYSLPQSGNLGSTGNVPDSLRPHNINPSAVKPGAGVYAGILFTKKISDRSSISAGLRYQFFTTTQSVGASVAASSNSSQRQETVFKAGIGNSYTNRYHLVQIPVEFNTKISNFKQHNLYATTGVLISQLLHTNALQFNNGSRQYFKDNSFFNKTSVAVTAGLCVNLRKESKPSLLLGPSFQYSFTPLADKGLYAKSHYSFLGLMMQKSLRRQ